VSALREIAASFGFDFDAGKLAQIDGRIREVLGSVYRLRRAAAGSDEAAKAAEDVATLKSVTKGFVAAIVVAAVAAHRFAESFAADAHAVRATATTLRVTTDELQATTNAFELAGLSAHEATAAFSTFHRNVRAAATGGGEAGGAFYRLGIRLRDNNRQVRSSNDVLTEVADRFGRITNPARAARVATQLFGDAGLQLLPILRQGRGGLAELRRETELLGGGLSGPAIEAARDYERAMTRWRIVGDAARSQLAIGLLPALAFLVDKARAVSLWLTRLFQTTHGVRNALAILGVVGAAVATALIVAWAPVILPVLAVVAAITALYLIIDDFVTFLEGGNSVIGQFVDTAFGPGTADAIRQHIRMIGEVREAYEGVIQLARDTGQFFGELFGVSAPTDHSGQSEADRALTRRIAEQRARREAATVAGHPALAGPAAVAGTIPISVPAPRARAGTTTVVQRTVAPEIHVHGGNATAAQIANTVLERIRQTERDAHDAGHPQQPRDE
jgi:hypothetical protein